MWFTRHFRRISKSGFRICYIIALAFFFIAALSFISTHVFENQQEDAPQSRRRNPPIENPEPAPNRPLQIHDNNDFDESPHLKADLPVSEEFIKARIRDPKNRGDERQKSVSYIDGEKYPKLSADGHFIPIRRWVHLDLKGAPFKVEYFQSLFPFMKSIGFTGVLLEWEDMFPFTGRLASAVNGNAYSMEQVETILGAAKQANLEIVPLVQTFGHLEWVLKLKEFAHLRDDAKFPQVICVGADEAWRLIVDMLNQVAAVHEKYGMRFFHIGADEVFQMGVCEANIAKIKKYGGRERTMLWHIARTAGHLKEKYKTVTVLAWHDMLERVTEQDLYDFNAHRLLEPMLWSYAEDLNQYLSFSTWMALKPFKNVWVASAYKGADGPMRYSSNPIHYIRNHESWITQMTRSFNEFDYVQGMVFTGWSRYDHFAVLCETLPVAIPTLAMSIETILKARPLDGAYDRSYHNLSCQPPLELASYVKACNFPGSKIYELVNEFYAQHTQLEKYRASDFEFNGWLSDLTSKYAFSSPMYVEKVMTFLDFYLQPMEQLEVDLRTEMSKIFFADAVDEFVLTYMSADLKFLRHHKKVAAELLAKRVFERRPFVDASSSSSVDKTPAETRKDSAALTDIWRR